MYYDGDLTIEEVANVFKVSQRSVRRWIASGELKAYRLPGDRLIRIEVESLDRLKGWI